MPELIANYFSIHTILFHFTFGGGYDLSYIEAVGTITGLLCIWDASQEKISNFYFGIINVSLFAIIFFQIQLYANLLLQIFFLAMNLYGLYVWSKPAAGHDKLVIRWLPKSQLLMVLVLSLLATLILAQYIDQFFADLASYSVKIMQLALPQIALPVLKADPYPLMDASATVLSLVAMIQMTRKLVENWLFWILINIISVILYAKQGVYFMAIEYTILTFITFNGCVQWIRSARRGS